MPLDLAYTTPRERVTGWLQEPAEPTPARFMLTTLVLLGTGAVALTVLLTVLYAVWVFLSASPTVP